MKTYTEREVAQLVVGADTTIALAGVAGAIAGAMFGPFGIAGAFIAGVAFAARSIYLSREWMQ